MHIAMGTGDGQQKSVSILTLMIVNSCDRQISRLLRVFFVFSALIDTEHAQRLRVCSANWLIVFSAMIKIRK